jgi:predicted MFS family arabinose efflux permease
MISSPVLPPLFWMATPPNVADVEAHNQPSAPEKSPALQLLSNSDFRRVWIAGALVGTMRWLDTLAVGVYVLNVTGSPFQVALILFLRTIPMFLFGVAAGAIVEKIDRRVLLLSVVGMLAVTYIVLTTLTLTGNLAVWHLGIGVFILGLYFAVELPTRRTMIADIAGLDRIGPAMGLESTTTNFTRMIGPFAGGILFEFFDIAGTQALGGVLYGISFLLILTAGYVRREPNPDSPKRSIAADIAEGLQFVARHRTVLATLLITVNSNIFAYSYITMVPAIAKQVMGLSAFPTGLLMTAEGFGAVMGATAVAFLSKPQRFNQVYFFGALGYLTSIFVFAASHSFWIALPVLCLGGLGGACFGAMQSTLIVSNTPLEMRNRIMGVLAMAIGAQPLGVLLVGWLSELFGPAIGLMTTSGLGIAIMAVCAMLWPEMRKRREAA